MSQKVKFIINTSVEYFAVNHASGVVLDEQTTEISEFLKNDDLTVISAVHDRENNKIKLKPFIPKDNSECLVFYKIPQIRTTTYSQTTTATSGTLDRQDPAVGILTLEGGLVKSIYNCASCVFSPYVAAEKTEYNVELSSLLDNLHDFVRSSLDLPKSDITTIFDEIKFWEHEITEKSASRVERETIQSLLNYLKDIAEKIYNLSKPNGISVEAFLDTAHNSLDKLWQLQCQYPEQRMADMLDCIGNQLMDIYIDKLLVEDIWSLGNPLISSLLGQCIETADSWIELCDSLTRLFWPNYVKHPWLRGVHTPKKVYLFKERILQIRNIKSLYEQIVSLTNDVDFQELIRTQSPFKAVNIYDTSIMGNTNWNTALERFEIMLRPIDERIAEALKKQMHKHLSNARQLITVFSKYETLIRRPTVLDLLTTEREQFMQSLKISLKGLRKTINDTNMELDADSPTTICNECRWLKIVQHQITEIEKVSYLISDREQYERVMKATLEIKEDTESLLRNYFDIWCCQFSNAIQCGNLKLRDDQPVVEFERKDRQLMRVTFNLQFITLCEDVREFENMDFTLPTEIRQAANHASKYISVARRLQQIASFYNTIGDQMIPCQRPIMLKNAKEFSELVNNETVAWQDEESVQRYVKTLLEAVSQLSSDNTLLMHHHENVKKMLLKLMNIDLINQGQMWKEKMQHLRALLVSLEHQGFTNLDTFKLHWDHQLYKVLECQYVSGLLSMNNKLSDIHIKIAFRQRKLCFIPSEEVIREKYFLQLRRFIERPYNFHGLTDKSRDLFRVMVETNRHYFSPLYDKAADLFKKLATFKKLWLPWVALGCVDIEELCGIHLQTAEDWECNFRQCKHFGQKIAKIEKNEESLDCFVIDITLLRSDLEMINRRYWDSLAHTLKSSILGDVEFVREFLETSLQFLQNSSFNETSIALSNTKYEQIKMELPKISEILKSAKAKDICLAGWCKKQVSLLSHQQTQWDRLQPLLENHAVVLQRQIDLVKTQAQGQMENLISDAEKFILRWESTITELNTNEKISLDLFKERLKYWHDILEKNSYLLEECNKLNILLPKESLNIINEIDEQVKKQSKPWLLYEQYLKEFSKIQEEEWTIYRHRPYDLNEFITKWEVSMIDSFDISSKHILRHVELLKNCLPILLQLQSEALTENHWLEVFTRLGKQTPKPLHMITLKDLLQDPLRLQQNSDEIAQIVRQAFSEQIVRQALNELDQWSMTFYLKTVEHTDSFGHSITLIKDYSDILNKIGENQSLLQSAKNSAAFDTFSDQVNLWESRLHNLDAILSGLNQSQRRWIYLEPVFGASALRNKETLFKRIDKDFRSIMNEIKMDPRIFSLTKINNISGIVKSLETQLKCCQNNLLSYVGEKRNAFPRFYFMGDDDLLELLGHGSKAPEIIQKHIKKIFPGCHALIIVQDSNNEEKVVFNIEAFKSLEGDVLKLTRPVEMKGPIENWLNTLVSVVQNTLREQISQCCNSYPPEGFNEQFLDQYVEQVLTTTRAVHFTSQVEKSIQSVSLPKLLHQLNKEIMKYAEWKQDTSYLVGQKALQQIKLRAILYEVAHYVTIVEQLIQHNVVHLNDWYWLAQLKFYIDGNKSSDVGQVVARMVYAEFQYSHEFLGNLNKLVNTRLTHKCYLVLTQAMQMGLGGNLFGPAGTGKTECVKALGAMLGRLVFVFNCDENIDADSIATILIGLTHCGAWGCFDEFNRLQETTLSSISMLIQPLQSALKNKSDAVNISHMKVKIDHNCAIYVTLNPAGIDYGGRQKLPGNLEALFRPIFMEYPEKKEIARVILFVEGFQQANEIAERVVELFDMCSKVLTQQRHYNWGLRELKILLLSCTKEFQNLKSSIYKNANEKILNNKENMEMHVVNHCLQTSIMPKLVHQDVKRFNILLKNVFPESNVITNSSNTINIKQRVKEAYDSLGLCFSERQVDKIVQLHDQLQKRMGVVLMGPPGCGKTTVIVVLRQLLGINYGQEIRVHTISPKSVTRSQLLGYLDPDTRQWFDGILTHIASVVNSEPDNVYSWIVCDGSVDPDWIEALNSVLDDNKLLTLPSGWRIQFGDNVNFIFETDNVLNASPATISRMGIVNMGEQDYPFKSIVDFNLNKLEYGDVLRNYVEELYEPVMARIEEDFSNELPFMTRASMTRALMLKLYGMQEVDKSIESREEFVIAVCQVTLRYLLIKQYNEISNWLLEKANIHIRPNQRPHLLYFNKATSCIQTYEDDYDTTKIMIDPEVDLVHTASIKMYLAQLKEILNDPKRAPFLLLGPSGSAKTLLLKWAVHEMVGYDLLIINCSTQLTPASIIRSLEQNCLSINTGSHGRKLKVKRKRLVMYLKNLDLCQLDAWGCNGITELLLQLVQRLGFYNVGDNISSTKTSTTTSTNINGGFANTNNLKWISVDGLQICGSVSQHHKESTTHETANTNLLKITPRYLAINHFLPISDPSNTDMLTVLQCKLLPLLQHHTDMFNTVKESNFKDFVLKTVHYISEGLMKFYEMLQTKFGIGSSANVQSSRMRLHSYAQYQFSPKLLLKVLENLKYYPINAFNEALLCELYSIFGDRLVTSEEVESFDIIIKHTLNKITTKEITFFITNFTNHNHELLQMTYDEWREEVQKHITICNAESFIIDAPLTNELMDQTAKISRLLARTNSHILLVGPAGGRQLDALYLAASMQKAQIHLLHGGNNYCLQEFYNDLKLVIQITALENQCTCFVLEQSWLNYVPELMNPIEALLEQSDFTLDLFAEDLQSITTSLKHQAQLEGFRESLISYFMKRVQQNLHLIICLDSGSEKTNELLTKYPALHRNTDMLYIRSLSKETCTFLPTKYIEELKQSTNPNQKISVSFRFNEIIDLVVLQQSPLRFYQLIKTYYFLYEKFFLDINRRLVKLQQGVDKLSAAHAVADSLKLRALQQEEALVEKRILAKEALDMITSTMRNANDQKSSMLELKKQTHVNSEKLKERQNEIQNELAEVKPILVEASMAVGQIKSEALSEIRSLRAPPEIIRDILEGVLRLMGVKDTSWNSMKTFLAKRGVKEDIRSLDPTRINQENCIAVDNLINAKSDSFDVKNAKRASVAAAPLAAWVKASVRYAKAIQSVKPLEEEQAELHRNLERAEAKMQSLVSGLDDVENRVKELSNKLNIYTQEAAVLELKMSNARQTLEAAEVLLQQLGTEYNLWSTQLNEYQETITKLDAQSLMIALVLNYYSHLPSKCRSNSINQLTSKLNLSDAFDIRKCLVTEQEQLIWESMGLPRDTQIIENAAITTQMLELPFGSVPTPLLIDPSETALHWLQEYFKFKEKNFELTSQNNPRFTYILELAVRFGKILIVQDCQDLRPPLVQTITKKLYMKFGKRQLEVAGKLIDLHGHFQLIFVTKTTKLQLYDITQAYITCIPFTITTIGLSDQLISKAIIIKNPSLEEKRVELLKNEGTLLKQRLDLEDKLLKELSQAEGDILKNEKLLKTLNDIKQSSSFIDKSLQESNVIREAILKDFSSLRAICYKAAEFFIALNSNYNLPPDIFVQMFLNSLGSYDIISESQNEQIQMKFYKVLLRETFHYLARSLCRNEHLLLAMFICSCAFKETIHDYEWELFVTHFMGASDLNDVTSLENIHISEIFDKEMSLKLRAWVHQKPTLVSRLQLHNSSLWRNFLDGTSQEIPVTLFSSFENLLLIQIIRPDLLTMYMRLTAEHLLGTSIGAQCQPTIEQLIRESSNDKPILMLSQGQDDPSVEIYSLALQQNNCNKYQELSMGKGMEKKAWEEIKQTSESGKWLCLKNVHLVPEWVNHLNREMSELPKSPEFRLWLVCESTRHFNESIMYQFIKVLYERPIGIKQRSIRFIKNYANMERNHSIPKEAKSIKIRVALFLLVSVLQERCRYIPHGWSQNYDFGEADVKVALQVIKLFDKVLMNSIIDWTIIQKLNENFCFGGRISNPRDLQILQKYLKEFFNNNILSQHWKPFKDAAIVPTSAQWSDYLNALTKMPNFDDPEIFKLSRRSNISREIECGEKIIKELRGIYFGFSRNEQENLYKLEKQIKPIFTLWRKLAFSKLNSLVKSTKLYDAKNQLTPWLVFLHTELKIAGQGYHLIHTTLSRAYDALKDRRITQAKPLLDILATYQIPEEWQRLWCGPANILDYLKAFMVRAQSAETRFIDCENLEFIEEIDLSTVFCSQTLLATLKLLTAEKLHTSCQCVILESQCITHKTNRSYVKSPYALLLKPLLLNGAVFVENRLMLTSIDKQKECQKSPQIFVYFKEKSIKSIQTQSTSLDESVKLPLYTNDTRKILLCELEVPTKESADVVLLSGAALLVADY